MKDVYEVAGVSKQASFQYQGKRNQEEIYYENLFLKADAIRAVHPKISARKMYDIIAPEHIGRDKFEALLLNNGYRVYYPPNYIRTTYSVKCYQYTNLIKGIELTGVNQVWQSDITYFWSGGKFYYLVFIEDVFSRRIVGYNASRSLATASNIHALQMAFKLRGQEKYEGLIHHSDRGSQYASNAYTDLLLSYECNISMCNAAYENAYVERVNGIIKNEYLGCKNINGLSDLEKELKKAVYAYNYGRPHLSLINKLTPVDFEEYVLSLIAEERPTVKLYTDGQEQEVNNE
jgi:putative transposase